MYGDGWMVAAVFISAVVSVLTLLFNRLRLYWVATTWFTLTALGYEATVCFLGGVDFHAQYYFLVHAVGPFLLFPPRHRITLFIITGLALFTLGAFGAVPELAVGGHFIAPRAVSEALRVVNITGTFLALSAFAYYGRRRAAVAEAELEGERAKTEDLLLNVLPATIAERLKGGERTIVDAHSEVTVLFADIVDFTALSEKVTPNDIAVWLNAVFGEFDQLADKHGLEKIKTIGDAYMAGSGLPEHRDDHLEAAAEMALDMARSASRMKRPDGDALALRVGIHTGPVTAGVIGTHKFIYDLWGDTVNTASRMESLGSAGSIQVTEQTYEKLRVRYELEPRGQIAVKGKGRLTTWWLVGAKERGMAV